MLKLIERKKDNKKPECKGRIYRYRENSYYKDGSIYVRKSLRLLKRISCPGCEKCGWIEESLEIDMDCAQAYERDYLADLKPEKIYQLRAQWHPGSYEYPQEGELEITFEEIK